MMKMCVVAAALITALLLPGCNAGGVSQMAGTEAAAAPAGNQVTTSAAALISPDRAQSIALEHAGFTADQVSRLRTQYEVDDGVALYEVKFRQDRWEYDYEIDAKSGAILSYDRDD